MNEKYETRESIVLENDHQKIFAIFHKPINTLKKCPAVLFCHGFAGQKTGKYRLYVTLAEELAKSGIASLRFDFRGCGDSEGNLSQSSLDAQVKDALKCLQFLTHHLDVDETRLGIFGRSLGGAIAVMAAKEFGSAKSLALWAPLFGAKPWKQELAHLKNKTPMIVNGQIVGMGFLSGIMKMQLEQDLSYLEEVPLLHIQGEKDTVITIDHQKSYQLCRSLVKAKTLFLNLKKCDHDFSDLEEREEATIETVAWFKSTLKGES